MQDRFKYRAWDKNLKTMRPVWSFTPFGAIVADLKTKSVSLPFKDCEIMQCTGLKDKNGKLIHEGDIVYKKGNKDHKGNKMFSTVVWCSMYAEFNISDENGLHRMPSNPNNVEIIGNIYESPELLENLNV